MIFNETTTVKHLGMKIAI